MTVARIIMSEHPSVDSFNTFLDGHREAVKHGFLSNADFSVSVQTGPNSNLILTTYSDQSTANSNLTERQDWFASREHLISDTFYYEGEVKTILRGGGEELLTDRTKEIELTAKVDNLTNETNNLKVELKELKEMLSQVLAKLPC